MSTRSYTSYKEDGKKPRKRMSRKERERRARQRRIQALAVRGAVLLVVLLFLLGMGFGIHEIYRRATREPVEQPELTVDYLTENPYSRPGMN